MMAMETKERTYSRSFTRLGRVTLKKDHRYYAARTIFQRPHMDRACVVVLLDKDEGTVAGTVVFGGGHKAREHAIEAAREFNKIIQYNGGKW